MALLPEESGCSLVERCFADHTLVFLLALTDEGRALKGLGHHCSATVTLSMKFQSICYSWCAHASTLSLNWIHYLPSPFGRGVMGQSGRRNCHPSPPFCRLSMEPARHTLVFLELPKPATPIFPKGSIKLQTNLYHHFLLEPRTAKIANISVTYHFTVHYGVAGQENTNLVSLVPGAHRGPPRWEWEEYIEKYFLNHMQAIR